MFFGNIRYTLPIVDNIVDEVLKSLNNIEFYTSFHEKVFTNLDALVHNFSNYYKKKMRIITI
jgi:hypothetical protein